MSLDDWLKADWLRPHHATPEEIRKLMIAVDRDLTDCQSTSISTDWRFNIAYNAVLRVSIVALAAEGYRASRDQNHYRSIQSLRLTMGLESDTLDVLDRFRKKRNIVGYEEVDAVSDKELLEIISLARSLRQRIGDWLRLKHPDVLTTDR